MAELLAIQIGKTRCTEREMYGKSGVAKVLSQHRAEPEVITPIPDILCRQREAVLDPLQAGVFEGVAPLAKEPSDEPTVDYCCFIYLVRTPSRLILIDTGFNNQVLAERVGCEEHTTAVTQLAKLGIEARQITDVVLTHAHWSNCGGLADFLHARLYISVRELNAMERALERGRNRHDAYRVEDMRTIGMASRLHMVKRGLAIDEHLRLDVVGGHTYGFMLPTFMTEGVSRVMLAADNVPMYRHLNGEMFPEEWCDCGTDIRERLKMRMHTAYALPGRDPKIFQRYPSVVPGIVRIFSDEVDSM